MEKLTLQKARTFLHGLTEPTVSTLLRSVLISLVLLLVPILLLVGVDKARQLILSEITVDPVISTFLVYAVCLMNLYVFAQRHRSSGKIIHQAGELTKILIWVILLGPLFGWVWTIYTFTEAGSPLPYISFFLAALLLYDLVANILSLLFDDRSRKNVVERFFDHLFKGLATRIRLTQLFDINPARKHEDKDKEAADFRYYRIKRILFWTVFVSLVYNVINYEIIDFSETIGEYSVLEESHKTETLIIFIVRFFAKMIAFLIRGKLISIILSTLWLLFMYRYWFYMNYFLVQENGKRTLKLIINIIFTVLTVLAVAILMYVGTFPAFDIILIFTLTLRYVLILWPLSIRRIVHNRGLLREDGFLRKIFALNIPAIKLVLSMLFVLLTLIFITDWLAWNDNERRIYEFKTQDYNPQGRQSLASALEGRIGAETGSTQPLILVLGQGGGSRAGATMFNALSRLDSAGYGPNILAIISISGSSNGAGFYLHGKVNGLEGNIHKNTDTLYQHDYVTASLFKMLYTDFVFSEFPRLNFLTSRKNRNEQLMAAEAERSKTIGQSDGVSQLESPWSKLYPDTGTNTLPLFFPVSYNISRAGKAVSSPYSFDIPVSSRGTYYSLYDTLSSNGKELTLGQSIALSEMFPFISASPTIQTPQGKYENYMDGGVYDNIAYEVAHDIYNAVSRARDTLAPERPVVLIAVQNGEVYTDPKYNFKTDASATIGSVTSTIFKTNVIAHSQALEGDLKDRDRLLNVYSYKKYPPRGTPSDSTKQEEDFVVVMSRYLTKKEVSAIDRNVKTWVEKIVKDGL